MSDFLLQLGAIPQARRLIRTLGLPIPLPQQLRRGRGPWEARPLADWEVGVGGAPGAELGPVVAKTLAAAGANPWVRPADAGDLAVFRALGEAHGRPPRSLDPGTLPENARFQALVFDATGIGDPAGLRALHDFFSPLLPRLSASGRVVLLARPADEATRAATAAARAALDGFVRSLAKEIGKRGSTAQLLCLREEATPARIEPVLRFLLSPRSAFVTGQTFSVSGGSGGNGETAFVRPLEGKVALVTGAARGIGEATAQRLAAEGAQVVCLDRPADDGPASQVARAVGGSLLLADVSDPGAPAAIARHLHERHGGVDVVVHNAGVTRDKTLARMSPELWDQVLGINLSAILGIDEALLGGGLLRDGGRIVCLSSVSGIAGNVGQTNYAAAKAGILGYVRQRARALAPRRITVNAVAPGFIETRLTAAMPLAIREAARRLSALGQGGLPGDVAEVITFLASPGAAGVSGAALRVCGGALVGA